MSDNKEKETEAGILKVVAIALGLPSAILSVFFAMYYLINQGYIPAWLGMVMIVIMIVYLFYLMARNVYKK